MKIQFSNHVPVNSLNLLLIIFETGIAFEQGKQLPTPETIPFRLTRDLVDGMGITGVEGVFRRCCEKVMDLMRNSQEAILTIVEVRFSYLIFPGVRRRCCGTNCVIF